jgi:hypothetical protein
MHAGSAAADAAAAGTQLAEEPHLLLGAAPPSVQLPVWGSVQEHQWGIQADRAAACSSISTVLLRQNRSCNYKNPRRTGEGPCQWIGIAAADSSADTQAAAAERLLLLSAEQQPLVLRGLAADWPAVSQQGWGLGWLAQQGFSGKVRLAPSLQFPFVEPQLVQYLDRIAGEAVRTL